MVYRLWQRLSAKERAVLACVLAECLFVAFVWVAPRDVSGTALMVLFIGGPLTVWLWPGLVRHFRAQVQREQQGANPPLHWAGGPNLP